MPNSCPHALQLVGVRIPDHGFMRRLCQMCGEPLALTSANISSQTSTVAANVSGGVMERRVDARAETLFLLGICSMFLGI